jgi:hypothetical protein
LKVPSKRNRRRAILVDAPQTERVPAELKPIRFGSPRHPADRCTLIGAPAQFGLCFDCSYNHGAQGDGILCAHRFGLDPTLIDGTLTQVQGDQIIFLEKQDSL